MPEILHRDIGLSPDTVSHILVAVVPEKWFFCELFRDNRHQSVLNGQFLTTNLANANRSRVSSTHKVKTVKKIGGGAPVLGLGHGSCCQKHKFQGVIVFHRETLFHVEETYGGIQVVATTASSINGTFMANYPGTFHGT